MAKPKSDTRPPTRASSIASRRASGTLTLPSSATPMPLTSRAATIVGCRSVMGYSRCGAPCGGGSLEVRSRGVVVQQVVRRNPVLGGVARHLLPGDAVRPGVLVQPDLAADVIH